MKLAVLIALSLALLIPINTLSNSSTIAINWKVISDPSENNDFAYAVCEYGDYIYIVGSEGDYGRVELRSKENGELIDSYTLVTQDSYHATFLDCIVAGEKLYVIGYQQEDWTYYSLFLVFTPMLNLVHLERGGVENVIFVRIFGDEDYLYVAGVHLGETQETVFINKVSISDLSIVKTHTESLPNTFLIPTSININPLTGEIWVAIAHADQQFFIGNSSIVIVDEELEKQESIHLADSIIFSITFDNEGYAYISGYFVNNYTSFILKLDPLGMIIDKLETIGLGVGALTYSHPYLYAITTDEGEVYFITVLDTRLDQISEVQLNDENEWFFTNILAIKMTCDNTNLYLAGSVYTAKTWSYAWVIYSIKLTKPFEAPSQEPVQMTTVTITYTQTMTNTETKIAILTKTVASTTTVTLTVKDTETITLRENLTVTETNIQRSLAGTKIY